MIAAALKVSVHQVDNTLSLLGGGATIPFISRYRKEATGGLDEVQIGEIKDRNDKLCELAKRKETILSTIEEQGKLTEELRKRIEQSWDATEVEDIYLPYKPKRKTRAEAARQKGLEPLATLLLLQRENHLDSRLPAFVKGDVKDEEDALKGARDIIAEQVSEDERARNQLRNQFSRQAVITSKVVKGKEEEAAKYRDYFDFSEPLKRCSSHRLLAIRRGESEGLLKVSISPDDEECAGRLEQMYVRGNNECSRQVGEAVRDAYKRLLKPSIETEFSALSKEKADEEAIRVFAGNLRQLLLAPPLGQKRVMGVDPGYRTGCKIVCLDAQGSLLHNETIYPHPPKNEYSQAARSIVKLVEQYQIEAIAIGNGTASRETEQFITSQRYNRELQVFVVSEDGASIYSASKTARDEFPEYDVTVRGAVSIGRRLMDPLAELVKIDPKAVGVGQYQHDMPQKRLNETLDGVVEDCVNSVGVDLNTASAPLLARVAGITNATAKNIVAWREEEGAFTSRAQLKKVKGLGPKAFEQCAGFLRLPGAKNPLDATAVHPESYPAAKGLLEACGCDAKEIGTDAMQSLPVRVKSRGTKALCEALGVGEPTLMDIVSELCKPGRDVRDSLPKPLLRSDVMGLEDLKPGMELKGTVRNVIDFGAFVDIGVHQDGLVHVSQISDKFIKNPRDALKVGDVVQVKVLSVDTAKKRIALTMKGVPQS